MQHNHNMCPTESQPENNSTFTFEEDSIDGMYPQIKEHVPLSSVHWYRYIKYHFNLFMPILSDTNIKPENMNSASVSDNIYLMCIIKFYTMETMQYWPFARKYSIWNAAVSILQFWTADLKTYILSKAIERVYTAFFCSNSSLQLWKLYE